MYVLPATTTHARAPIPRGGALVLNGAQEVIHTPSFRALDARVVTALASDMRARLVEHDVL